MTATSSSWPSLPNSVTNALMARIGSAYSEWHSETLNDTLSKYCRDYGLSINKVLTGGSAAAVYAADHPAEGPVVLKIHVDKLRAQREISAWQAWPSHMLPRLIHGDVGSGALLMQRMLPGSLMEDAGDSDDVTNAAASLLIGIQAGLPQTDAPPVADLIERRSERALIYLSKGVGRDIIDASSVNRSVVLANRLFERGIGTDVIVHGDFYPNNIVSNLDSWTAIDPEPCVGEAAFDAGTWVYGRGRGRTPEHYAEIFSEKLGIETSRILGWAAVVAATNLVFRLAWNHAEAGEIDSTMALISNQFQAWGV